MQKEFDPTNERKVAIDTVVAFNLSLSRLNSISEMSEEELTAYAYRFHFHKTILDVVTKSMMMKGNIRNGINIPGAFTDFQELIKADVEILRDMERGDYKSFKMNVGASDVDYRFDTKLMKLSALANILPEQGRTNKRLSVPWKNPEIRDLVDAFRHIQSS